MTRRRISDDGAVVGLEATALKMNKKWFAHSDHDWISVIKTNMRYDRMGLGAGMNYIFKLPQSDPAHELVVVPEDASIAPHYLTYNPYID